MILLARTYVEPVLRRVSNLSVAGWVVVFFVTWAAGRSAVSGDVFGVALALLVLLAGLRWFGPQLRRDGGAR